MACVEIERAARTSEPFVFFGDGVHENSNWRKGEKIGEGAFGKVFKAIVERSDAKLELAVKKVRIGELHHLQDSVKKETDAMTKMCHNKIVKCFGSHVINSSFYIFLELMKEGSLETFIKKNYEQGKQINESYAGRIIRQVIEAVDYLHENKHFHRDIKSANVLMSDEHNVKLADFGLTREFEEMTKSYTKGVGTSRFMAPEMVAVDDDGRGFDYSNPVDIWAIGCIVVHMLTGELPFSKLSDRQVNSRLLQPDPSPAKGISLTLSESCDIFLRKTLVKDPKARATARSLLSENFVTGKPLEDLEIDAEVEKSNPELQKLDEKNDLKYPSITKNVAIGHQYQNCETNYTFQKEVNFNSDVQVDKVDTLNVKHLESLNAKKVGKVDVQQASGSVSVGQAESVNAQGNSVHVQTANTVDTKDTNAVNVHKAGKLKADQAEVINIDRVHNLVIK